MRRSSTAYKDREEWQEHKWTHKPWLYFLVKDFQCLLSIRYTLILSGISICTSAALLPKKVVVVRNLLCFSQCEVLCFFGKVRKHHLEWIRPWKRFLLWSWFQLLRYLGFFWIMGIICGIAFRLNFRKMRDSPIHELLNLTVRKVISIYCFALWFWAFLCQMMAAVFRTDLWIIVWFIGNFSILMRMVMLAMWQLVGTSWRGKKEPN